MRELVQPIEAAWNWVGTNLGMPGQMLLICTVVIAVLAMFVWIGNRRGAVG
jgi:hypothetical protein